MTEILYVEENAQAPYYFPSSELVWNVLLSSDILDKKDTTSHHRKDWIYCQTDYNMKLIIEYCKRIGIIEVEYKPTEWFNDKGDYKYGNTLK